ncbi:Ser/Thr phosphatase, putative [Acanthamoeba castellanii str. Neff]|uniref:Ser/Thr phosphatase, putative n=1 Tax=Acanthamoeba castellanii (strain ATCC 30010 / Neff) TaxID=1257118 RepID=L8GYM9_ACACF|nr:Ser/Thr phosphatase, putative [Acanthamoeba castellanii str. Neff]ELR17623.1 Ser/Thr phosphatase, putative [Acanthamoeba castellanii str. Neff]
MGNSAPGVGVSTRVFACSDLHVDHKSNWAHLQEVVKEGGYTGRDVLIVAGDVSTELSLLRRTLGFLAEVFHGGHDEGANEDEEEEEEERSTKKRMSNVFFCPGNNELRLARSDKKQNGTCDSLAKLADVLRVCEEVGVHTQPAKVNGQVWVVPLLAWYTPSFDPEWDRESHDYRRGWLDFRACAWPAELDGAVGGVAAHFLARNEEWMDSSLLPFDAPVVSFSHFLPRFELLPKRIFLLNKTLPLVVGDERLDEQIRRIGSQVHVFGHTHIDKDKVIDSVRYVQNAFGHPAERNKVWHALKATYRPKLVLEVFPDGRSRSEDQRGSDREEEGEDEDEASEEPHEDESNKRKRKKKQK